MIPNVNSNNVNPNPDNFSLPTELNEESIARLGRLLLEFDSRTDSKTRPIDTRNAVVKFVDHIFYNMYSFVNPPKLLPLSPFYTHIPPQRKRYYDGEIDSYEELRAYMMDKEQGPLPKWAQDHIAEFDDPKDRMEQARRMCEGLVTGTWGVGNKEQSAREWTIRYLCKSELEQLWASEYRKRWEDSEYETVEFFKKNDPDYKKNQKELARHKEEWDSMSHINRAKTTLPPYIAVAATVTVLLRFFFLV